MKTSSYIYTRIDTRLVRWGYMDHWSICVDADFAEKLIEVSNTRV